MQRWIMWRGQHITLTALTFLKSSELTYAKIFVSACVCVCVGGCGCGCGGEGGLGTCTCAVCVGVMKVFYVKALVQLSYSVALLCNTLVSYPGSGADLGWWAQR